MHVYWVQERQRRSQRARLKAPLPSCCATYKGLTLSRMPSIIRFPLPAPVEDPDYWAQATLATLWHQRKSCTTTPFNLLSNIRMQRQKRKNKLKLAVQAPKMIANDHFLLTGWHGLQKNTTR
ncbi:hypothetical protein M5D96_000109, partial [Drosophila gunungcola]